MKKFEYYVITTMSSLMEPARMNAIGDDGWELVAFVPSQTITGYEVYFKREKDEAKTHHMHVRDCIKDCPVCEALRRSQLRDPR